MKKRFEQRLVLVSLITFILLNIPFISVWNKSCYVLGFPLLWLWIFLIWILVILVSFITLKSGDE